MKTLFLAITFLLAAFVSRADAFVFPMTNAAPVQLAWNASPTPGVTNYYMYWGVGSRQYTNKVQTGNVLQFGVSNLVKGVTYYFSCTATNWGQESDFSNEVTYTTPNVLPPTMKPVVVLVVEYKNDLQDWMWADTDMRWTLTPEQSKQFYRLEMATVALPIAEPQLRIITLPPVPLKPLPPM